MNPPNVQVLTVQGTPRERGRAQGETLRPRIDDTVRRWKAYLAESYSVDPDEYLARLLSKTRFLQAAERWTPHLVDEVRGIAEGAAQPFDTMFARQLADEISWYALYSQVGDPTADLDHCSAVGIQRQAAHPPMVAQNLDVPNVYDGTQIVLRIKYPDDFEALVYTWVGSLATNGINNRGVAVCENTVLQLDHASDGLPVDFVTRGILESRGLGEAVDFCRRVRHASGQNYIIGAPDGVVDLECSAHQVVEWAPGAQRVFHTNHPLASDDMGQFRAGIPLVPPEKRGQLETWTNSRVRLATLEARLGGGDEVTVPRIQETLRSHDSSDGPVCVHNERIFSSASMVMECSDMPVFHVCFGPPCRNQFTRITF